MERTGKTGNPERDRELEGKARTLVIIPTLREAFEIRGVKKDKGWWKFWK